MARNTPKPPTDRLHRQARRQGRLRQALEAETRHEYAEENSQAGIGERDAVTEARDTNQFWRAGKGRIGVRWQPGEPSL